MNEELERRLHEKFSSYFISKDIGFGTYYYISTECNDGWFNIIWDCCEKIEKLNSNSDFKFSQIKEKFGSLRLYHYGATDEIDKILNDAETLSEKTCESCGNKATIKTIRGWYICICDKCEKGRGND